MSGSVLGLWWLVSQNHKLRTYLSYSAAVEEQLATGLLVQGTDWWILFVSVRLCVTVLLWCVAPGALCCFFAFLVIPG